jgi:hypothetical protein
MTLRSDQEDTTAQELSETFDTAAFRQAQRGGWKFRPELPTDATSGATRMEGPRLAKPFAHWRPAASSAESCLPHGSRAARPRSLRPTWRN